MWETNLNLQNHPNHRLTHPVGNISKSILSLAEGRLYQNVRNCVEGRARRLCPKRGCSHHLSGPLSSNHWPVTLVGKKASPPKNLTNFHFFSSIYRQTFSFSVTQLNANHAIQCNSMQHKFQFGATQLTSFTITTERSIIMQKNGHQSPISFITLLYNIHAFSILLLVTRCFWIELLIKRAILLNQHTILMFFN